MTSSLALGSLPWDRERARGIALRLLSVAIAALLVSAGTAAIAAIGARRHVIVRTLPGFERAVEREITRLGGQVGIELPIVNGFVATIPDSSLLALNEDTAVVAVTPNGRLTFSSTYDASSDPYSLHNVAASIRATNMWQAGYTGAGVDVALIDSGVVPVQGLSGSANVLNGPDLSFESRNPQLRYLDTYGHGTFMAGIIAGRDNAAVPGSYANDTTDFLGIAPDARIVSIKVADSHGNTDVSQVIAAIAWVVQHAQDSGLNIRVLNLSFGTASVQSYVLDPLAYAAEVAWRHGIAVVAAVGNSGITSGGLADPAYDPFVVAVGAADNHGSMQYSQWNAASFSQTGDGIRNPDILAPGAHIQSLRDPGSYIDQTYPGGMISDRFFRGSGSSEAAAVVSGALADMFQQHPSMTPDQAKALLVGQGNNLRQPASYGARQGQVAIRLDTVMSAPVPMAVQTFTPSTGSGSLESTRGSTHVWVNASQVRGEQDAAGQAFNSGAMAGQEATGNSWSGGGWNGGAWSGGNWNGNSWSGDGQSAWSGDSWSGNSWSGNSWSGNTWSGNSWSGNSWTGNSWSGNSWSGDSWSGNSWSGAYWG